MSDDPKQRDNRDRSRVSSQKHEINYEAEKTGTNAQTVRDAKEQAGSSNREKVEREIQRDKR